MKNSFIHHPIPSKRFSTDYVFKDLERIIKDSEEGLDLYSIITNVSIKVQLKIPSTLIQVSAIDTIFLVTFKDSVETIRKK
jgi:hypothetical protein